MAKQIVCDYCGYSITKRRLVFVISKYKNLDEWPSCESHDFCCKACVENWIKETFRDQ